MALFENFPYTNLHELNLDWLIDVLNQLKDSAVFSVNGQTGDVILYEDASVILPDVTEATWSFFRTADGVVRGITFSNDGNAYIMNGDQIYKVYDSHNSPNLDAQFIRLYSLNDEQMTNWNIYRTINGVVSGIQFDTDGTGYIMSGNNRYKIYSQHDAPPYPVSSVNGETGAVILYKSNQVRLPDIVDEAGDPPTTFWNIFRYINNGYYGIQFNTNGTAQIILPNNVKYTIYTNNNLPPYPDEPFINLDDDILEFAEAASLEDWGLIRETDNGTIGIKFTYPSTGPTAYLRYYDSGTDSYITKKLLTIDDIPTSSGVVSINGQQGVLLLNGTNIPRSQNDPTPLNTTIDEKAKAENVAYYESTNTASQNIPSGSFVFWNGGAYVANQAISLGDTLSLTNLDAVAAGGIANALNGKITNTEYANITVPTGITANSALVGRCGKICCAQPIITSSSSIPQYGLLCTLPWKFTAMPLVQVYDGNTFDYQGVAYYENQQLYFGKSGGLAAGKHRLSIVGITE